MSTSFFRTTELIRTGPSQFSCSLPILGDGSDQLQSQLHLLEVKKLDQTRLLNTTEDTSLSLSHAMYPTKLQLSTLDGKRTDIYNYLSAAQKTKYAVTPIHTREKYILFHNSVSIGGQWFSSTGVSNFATVVISSK